LKGKVFVFEVGPPSNFKEMKKSVSTKVKSDESPSHEAARRPSSGVSQKSSIEISPVPVQGPDQTPCPPLKYQHKDHVLKKSKSKDQATAQKKDQTDRKRFPGRMQGKGRGSGMAIDHGNGKGRGRGNGNGSQAPLLQTDEENKRLENEERQNISLAGDAHEREWRPVLQTLCFECQKFSVENKTTECKACSRWFCLVCSPDHEGDCDMNVVDHCEGCLARKTLVYKCPWCRRNVACEASCLESGHLRGGPSHCPDYPRSLYTTAVPRVPQLLNNQTPLPPHITVHKTWCWFDSLIEALSSVHSHFTCGPKCRVLQSPSFTSCRDVAIASTDFQKSAIIGRMWLHYKEAAIRYNLAGFYINQYNDAAEALAKALSDWTEFGCERTTHAMILRTIRSLRCFKCARSWEGSTTDNKYLQLSVLPTLEGSLDAYFQGDVCPPSFRGPEDKCECAHHAVYFNNQQIVGTLPPVLMFAFTRNTQDDSFRPQKNMTKVQYPVRLDLRRWMKHAPAMGAWYALRACIMHYGTGQEGGHYIAITSRDSAQGRVFYVCNDLDECKQCPTLDCELDAVQYANRAGQVAVLIYERENCDLLVDQRKCRSCPPY
jgi:hypothetical protein